MTVESGQEAIAEEVEEIPRVLPCLGFQEGTQEATRVGCQEDDQPFTIDEDGEDEEIGNLLGLALDAQELIKVSLSHFVINSFFPLPSDVTSLPLFTPELGEAS